MTMLFLILMGFLSYIFVGLFRSYAIKKNLLDHPNQRSSHSSPIPRGCGIMFPILWSLGLLFLYFIGFLNIWYLRVFLPPVFLISIVGFLDDKHQLAARWRFLAQLVATVYILIIAGGFSTFNLGIITIHWGWLGYVIIALALLWATNLYNFMDGIDGISAVEGLFVFGVGGYFIWRAGGSELAIIVWSVAVIIFGFLLWNKPPAKIFMGDAGSTFLGFLVALFAIVGEKKYHVSALLWVILCGVFWFDATLTLIRRLINGDKWYQAHKLHAFQRLLLQQWSHGKILLGVVAINIVLVAFAFLAFYFPQYMLISLVGVVATLLGVYICVEKAQPMYPSKVAASEKF